MNQMLQDFARNYLKDGLAKLSEENRRIFRLMYANATPDAPIELVVSRMPVEKLDWAMEQVRRTLEKNS